MEEQFLQDTKHHLIPKPDGLTKKILNNTATLHDFTKYDKTLSRYIVTLGYIYQQTNCKNIQSCYSFLSMLIQIFKDFFTYIADVNCQILYSADMSFLNIHKDIPEFYCVKAEKSYSLIDLPISEIKLLYDWLANIIETEEIFSPNKSFFQVFNKNMIEALQKIIKNKKYYLFL